MLLALWVLVLAGGYLGAAALVLVPGDFWSLPAVSFTIAVSGICSVIALIRRVPERAMFGAAAAAALAMTALSGALLPVGVVIVLGLVAYGIGARLLNLLAVRSGLTDGEWVACSICVGFGVTSYVALGLALLGMLAVWPAGLAILIAGVTCRGELAGFLSLLRACWPKVVTTARGAPVMALICAWSVAVIAQTVAPEIQFDSLGYHLGIVREYVAAGRLIDIPEEVRSYYYLGAEMNFALAMLVGGSVAAKFLSLLFVTIGALGLRAFAREALSEKVAGIATVLFLGTPVIMWEATTTYVDGIVTTYALLCATTAYRATRTGDLRLALVAGSLGGLAIATKLTAVLVVAPIFVVIVFGAFRRRGPRRAAIFAGAALMAVAPWPILRYAQAGNPVFPLLNAVFRSPLWPPVNESFGIARFGLHGTDNVLLPVALTFDASRFVEGLSGPALGLCLLLAPFALLWRRTSPAIVPFATIGLGTFLLWAATAQYLRYVIPMVAPLTMLAAVTLANASELIGRRAVGRVVGVVPFLLASAGLVLWLGDYRNVPGGVPYGVALGLERPASYLERALHTYAPLQVVAATAGARSYVLIASCDFGTDDEDRLYAPGRVDTCESPWSKRLYQVTDNAEAIQLLRERGITHVLVNRAGLRGAMRDAAAFNPGFLEQNATLLYRAGSIELHALRLGD